MSGTNFVFNVAKGRMRQYYDSVQQNLVIATGPIQSTANSALIIVPLETTGLEADATLNNYDDLLALLAASNNEQTTMGRKTVTDAALSASAQDDTGDWLQLAIPDQTWTAATGNAIAKLLVCYDGDTTAGTDANIVPLTAHSFDITPDGSDVLADFLDITGAANRGFFQAS